MDILEACWHLHELKESCSIQSVRLVNEETWQPQQGEHRPCHLGPQGNEGTSAIFSLCFLCRDPGGKLPMAWVEIRRLLGGKLEIVSGRISSEWQAYIGVFRIKGWSPAVNVPDEALIPIIANSSLAGLPILIPVTSSGQLSQISVGGKLNKTPNLTMWHW